MLEELSHEDVESLFKTQSIGHLGCNSNGRIYVVPTSYYYEQGSIYSFTLEGTKIRMMRENPDVCFQVEEIIDSDTWHSVIGWGTFEELKDAHHKTEVLTKLYKRITDLQKRGRHVFIPLEHRDNMVIGAMQGKEPIVYKIVLKELSGRKNHALME